jgi:hypothetical protein
MASGQGNHIFKRLFIFAAFAAIGSSVMAQTDAPAKLDSTGAFAVAALPT